MEQEAISDEPSDSMVIDADAEVVDYEFCVSRNMWVTAVYYEE